MKRNGVKEYLGCYYMFSHYFGISFIQFYENLYIRRSPQKSSQTIKFFNYYELAFPINVTHS